MVEELDKFMTAMDAAVAGMAAALYLDCPHHTAILQLDFDNFLQSKIHVLDHSLRTACNQPSLIIRADGKTLSVHKDCTCFKVLGR